MPNATRLEWIGKYAAILSALVAMAVGIGQYRRGVSQSIWELEWRQADMARTMVNAMMKDDGWQAMTMLDWEEGRTYEIAPGLTVRILPQDVPVAIEAALRVNGRKRTETQRFITDRYDIFLFQVSQLQGRYAPAWYARRMSSSRSIGTWRSGSVHTRSSCWRTSPRTPRSSRSNSSSRSMRGSGALLIDSTPHGPFQPRAARVTLDERCDTFFAHLKAFWRLSLSLRTGLTSAFPPAGTRQTTDRWPP